MTTPAKTPGSRRKNRLASEKSPYLLQHQYNPVDWQAWGEEAFRQAREQNKPVFLSIGYSTCHWCHVMERESFEDPAVADFLNQHFVSIKVDREERPDVDKIYMTFVQAMTGQGGWPLNIFLAPDLKPFYGGTYWPPESRHGRPGFLQILTQVQLAWTGRRQELDKSALELHQQLSNLTRRHPASSQSPEPGWINNAGLQLKQGYDPLNGGFGTAPKFPTPSLPSFLLAYGTRLHDDEAIRIVLHTCDRMAAGGICDQIGGGFSRYSVDSAWLVPHFEKMLYDNAQLLELYLDAFLVSGKARFAGVARDIISYVLRDMTHPMGGFYSAEDADSEGKEGKFYCWTKAEWSRLLTPEEFNVAVDYFGVTDEGNFVDHSDPEPLPNQNVLHIANPNLRPEDLPLLVSAREKIFQARTRRVRPHLDDKILASWNGLFLGSLARAGVVLPDPDCIAAAEKNLAFLRHTLWDAQNQTLFHRWREGERDSVQLLDGYASLLSGVIELYQATLNPDHLSFANALAHAMIRSFYDHELGGFWQSDNAADDLILRMKDDYDGAEPAGNSVAIYALLKLAAITGEAAFKNAAQHSLALFSDRLQRVPQAVPYMLRALDFSLEEPLRVIIAGDPGAQKTRLLLESAHSVYNPNRIILGTLGPVDPFSQTLPAKNDSPTAYVCTGNACQPPVTDPAQLGPLLKSASPGTQ